ncbi:hypothetical protein B0H11DRAFT_2035096 [Mycena galericulata]|nr:hypothetical protein B0H11DRAFT_2035096 [Mycena galericulata]
MYIISRKAGKLSTTVAITLLARAHQANTTNTPVGRPSILILQLKWLSSAMGCFHDIKSQADEPVLPMASRQALFKLQYRLVTQTSPPLFAPHSTRSHVLRCLPGVSFLHKHLHPHLHIPTLHVPASRSAPPSSSRPRVRPHSHSRVLRSARSPVPFCTLTSRLSYPSTLQLKSVPSSSRYSEWPGGGGRCVSQWRREEAQGR